MLTELLEYIPGPALTPFILPTAAGIGLVFVALCSALREPARQKFSAVFLGGAGAAYLSGGFGGWEFAFCTVITYLAFRGLDDYRAIGAGWVLHTIWDAAHHVWGNPIVPFDPTSSAGCAICDLVIAAWYFADAPSPWHRTPGREPSGTALPTSPRERLMS